MKNKLLCALVVVMMVVAVFGASPVKAAAYGTSFTTSITYQNVGTETATVSLEFYKSDGTLITIDRPDLEPMAGTSIWIGSLDELEPGFKGSAVMVSNQPLVATLVQIPAPASGVKVRPLSNGFTGGADYILIPTALRNAFNYNSILSIQNVDSVAADFRLEFVPVSGSSIVVEVENVPAYATKYFDLAQMSEITAPFNGSVQVYAFKAGTEEPGAAVASAMELSIVSTGAYAFEGTSEFGTTVYMPSALCKLNGTQTSSYAVQNTTDSDVEVTVTYEGGKEDGPYTLAPGTKRSFNGCDVNDPAYLGSAVINASGDIVAMGKIYGGGLSTAFLGVTGGSSKVALPYVRWTTEHWYDGTRQRAFIAIQNVGADLPAGAVTVKYYDKAGVLVGTDTLGAIPAGAKVNSNAGNIEAAEFGYYPDGTFGGSAIVEGPEGSQLAVIVRIQTRTGTTSVAEDYNGIAIQ